VSGERARTPAAPLVSPLRGLGRGLLGLLSGAGRVFAFSTPAAISAMTSAGGLRASSVQALMIASRCTLPVALVLTPIGAMVALQSLTLMRTFGVERALAPLVVASIVREMAPGFAAVVVAMQGGAGIAAELGAMRVKEELDALDVMGVDARGLVAGPRILGAALAAPLMNAVAIACGIAGAYAMAVLALDVPRTLFLETALSGITPMDVWISEVKAAIFGVGVGAVCATQGFFAQRGPAGVGRAANRAVVASVVLVLVGNYLVNTAIFGLKGGGVTL
jgi:phospholipid/cholesterol/gamma-HCH transport system permease protein